ncbi:MAG: class II fructose-bisphosphate aldolase [Phycisphaerales bacterium]|nr:MAG: class II fructose-bisphosphate aldolase [Phycisphaerales bacterium]
MSISEMLIPARSDGCAVGASEAWNLESVQAVVATADGQSHPVILQMGPYGAVHAGLQDAGL